MSNVQGIIPRCRLCIVMLCYCMPAPEYNSVYTVLPVCVMVKGN